MKREKQRKLNEADRQEIEALLREIELLLNHVILRIRERDSRIFKSRPPVRDRP